MNRRLIKHAAAIIADYARALKAGHINLDGTWPKEFAKIQAEHKDMVATAKKLRALVKS